MLFFLSKREGLRLISTVLGRKSKIMEKCLDCIVKHKNTTFLDLFWKAEKNFLLCIALAEKKR